MSFFIVTIESLPFIFYLIELTRRTRKIPVISFYRNLEGMQLPKADFGSLLNCVYY